MQVYDGGRFGTQDPGCAGLIAHIGHSDFGSQFLTFARSALGTDHVTAFATTHCGTIQTVLAENLGPRRVARTVADRYIRRHWNNDPVTRLLAGPAARDGRIIVDIDAADVEKGDYRRECYAEINLDHRLSVAEKRNGRTMRLSVYRARDDDFRQEDVARLGQMADLLMALLWRHDEAVSSEGSRGVDDNLDARIQRLEPGLTERERQVCALIAQGVTSEGIGLRLGIGLNTVLTYRKRAYARLGISSQNELMRRLMM